MQTTPQYLDHTCIIVTLLDTAVVTAIYIEDITPILTTKSFKNGATFSGFEVLFFIWFTLLVFIVTVDIDSYFSTCQIFKFKPEGRRQSILID